MERGDENDVYLWGAQVVGLGMSPRGGAYRRAAPRADTAGNN